MSVSENLNGGERNGRKLSVGYRSASPIRQYTAEELAPDGGWGWVVFAGVTLSFIVCFSGISSVGLIFGDYLTQSGNDGSAMTTLSVVMSTSFSCTALMCNHLLKKYNIKLIGVSGALIYSIAGTLTPFMPNIRYMAMVQFCQGIGAGTIGHISNTSLNAYFVKRRAMVFTTSQMIVSVGAIIYPVMAKTLLSTYGFRGCLFVFAGFGFHTVCGMLTLDPVEMHYKKPKRGLRREKEINEEGHFDDDENIEAKDNHFGDTKKGWKENTSLQSLKAEAENEKPLLVDTSKTSNLPQNRPMSGLDLEGGCQLRNSWRGSNPEIFTNRISLMAATSIASMSRAGGLCDLGHPIVDLESSKVPKENKSIKSILADFFSISLLSDCVYLNMCFGMTFMLVADGTFSTFLPLILAKDGYTTAEVTLTLTVAAIAELVSKIVLAGCAAMFDAKARHVYFGAACILFLSRIAFLHCHTFASMITVITIINLIRSWCIVTPSLVLAEHFKIERFAAASGLYVVFIGVFGLLLVPTIGYIKDWTNSYVVVQYILLGIMTLCIVPWSVEIFIYDVLPRYKKKTTQVETELPKN